MNIEIITIIAIVGSLIALIMASITACIEFKGKNKKISHFDRIYKNDNEYRKIVEDSNKAGKFNSPFIEDSNIFDTITMGCLIIEQNCGSLSETWQKDGDFDERPNWQKTA